MKSLIGLLAIAVILGMPVAHAQQAQRVQGGTSFDDAAVLDRGVYRDTIRPGETLFYSVDVGEGMRVRTQVVLVSKDRHPRLQTVLKVFNADRVEDVLARSGGYLSARKALKLVSVSGRVGDEDHRSPGATYLSLSVLGGEDVNAEYSMTIDLAPEPAAALPVVDPAPPPSPEPPPPPVPWVAYLLLLGAGAALGSASVLVAGKLGETPRGLRHRL